VKEAAEIMAKYVYNIEKQEDDVDELL